MNLSNLTPEQIAALLSGPMDPAAPMVPRGTLPPAPQMPEPTWQDVAVGDRTQAYPGEATEIPKATDFWSRLAEAQGPNPIGFHARTPNAAEVILGLAAAFSNFKTASAANKAKELEDKNERVRQSARDLALHRYQLKRQRELRADIRAAQEAGLDAKKNTLEQTTIPVQIGGKTVWVKPGDVIGGVKYGETVGEVPGGPTISGKNKPPYQPGGLNPPGTSEGDAEVAALAEKIRNGEYKPTDVPYNKKGAVAAFMKERNWTVLTDKARTTLNEMGAAENAWNQMKEQLAQVPAGSEGLGRFATGAQTGVQKFLQTGKVGRAATNYAKFRKGVTSALTRATGQTGVLTDLDVANATQLLPNFMDAGTMRADNIAALDRWFAEKKQEVYNNYTQPADVVMGITPASAAKPSANRPDPLGIRK